MTPSSTEPVHDPSMQSYVVGLLLDDQDRVALVRKLRPVWQAGRLNGIGGKIEVGESPVEAVQREFFEEAGLDLSGWDYFLHLGFGDAGVWFFRMRVEGAVLDSVSSCTDEEIEVHQITGLLEVDAGIIPNLRWILPLAGLTHDRYEPLSVREAQ